MIKQVIWLAYATVDNAAYNHYVMDEPSYNDAENLISADKARSIDVYQHPSPLPIPNEFISTIHQLTSNHLLKHISTAQLIRIAMMMVIPLQQTIWLHIDGEANRSITNGHKQLLQYKNIKTYYMSSASKENDIACTGVGYLPWQSKDGKTILVKCYYSCNSPDTIISPSDIVISNISQWHYWTQHADLVKNKGHTIYKNHNTDDTICYP